MRVCVCERTCVCLHACVCVLVYVLMYCRWPSAPDEVRKGLGPSGSVEAAIQGTRFFTTSGPSTAGTQFYPGAGGDTHFSPLPTPSSFWPLVGLSALLLEAPALE